MDKVVLTEATKETTQVVRTDNDTSLSIARMAKLIEPVLVLEDTPKYSLVITKKCECKQTAAANSDLQGLSTTEPRMHLGY